MPLGDLIWSSNVYGAFHKELAQMKRDIGGLQSRKVNVADLGDITGGKATLTSGFIANVPGNYLKAEATHILVANTTAEVDVFSVVLPATTFEYPNIVKMELVYDFFNSTGGDESVTQRLTLGSTIMIGQSLTLPSHATLSTRVFVTIYLFKDQWAHNPYEQFAIMRSSMGRDQSTSLMAVYSDAGTAAEDSFSALEAVVSIQPDTDTADHYLTRYSAVCLGPFEGMSQ